MPTTLSILVLLPEPEMPEHNLEPPRFCRRALERILSDWSAVRCVLSTGHRPDPSRSNTTQGASNATTGAPSADPLYEDQVYLRAQSGTQRLDKFTHTLLVKCSVEVRCFLSCFKCIYTLGRGGIRRVC